MNLRYLAAPAAVTGVVVGTVAGLALTPWAFVLPRGLRGAGRGRLGRHRRRGSRLPTGLRLPAVLATMHMSWGVGFLTSPSSLVPHPAR